MLSPGALLFFLCCCTLLLFGDRGVCSSNSISGGGAHSIRHDFNVTVAESGWIFASGMVGVAFSAPFAAHLSSTFNVLRLVGGGMLLASLGALGSALAPSFPVLLAFRCLSGVGCGPFISLAPPLIDDSAPRHRRSAFLAALFLCLPVGFASGYIWSTLIASKYGWRAAFLLEAALMGPLAAIGLLLTNPNDIARACAQSNNNKENFIKGSIILIQNPLILLTLLARAQFLGALGGFSFYGSKAAKAIFHLEPSTADLVFGGITIFTGAAGTLAGGFILDALGPSVTRSLMLCILSTTIAAVALSLSFGFSQTLLTFAPGFMIGEAALFSTSAPATAVLMWSSPLHLRATALALSEILNHALGDVPQPPILGFIQEKVKDWRVTMCCCMAVLALATLLFAMAKCCVNAGQLDSTEVVVVIANGEKDEEALHEPLLAGERD